MPKLLMKRKRRQWINCLHGKHSPLLYKEYSEKLKSIKKKRMRVFDGKIIYSFKKVHFLHLLHYSTGAGVVGVQIEETPCINLHFIHGQELDGFIITRADHGQFRNRLKEAGFIDFRIL